MKSFKEWLLNENHKGTITIDGEVVDIYAPNLVNMDISNIINTSRDIVVAVTDKGIPIVFRGDLDTSKIIRTLLSKSKKLQFAFYFVGNVHKKILSLSDGSPQDWQYRIPKTQIKRLAKQLERSFIGWKLPI